MGGHPDRPPDFFFSCDKFLDDGETVGYEDPYIRLKQDDYVEIRYLLFVEPKDRFKWHYR